MILRWEKVQHSNSSYFADTPLGRYLIKREGKGSRTFLVYLNGNRTSYYGTFDDCKKSVERAVNQSETGMKWYAVRFNSTTGFPTLEHRFQKESDLAARLYAEYLTRQLSTSPWFMGTSLFRTEGEEDIYTGTVKPDLGVKWESL